MRKLLCQPFIKIIYPKDIFMCNFPLIRCTASCWIHLWHTAVHIPFYIGHRSIQQNFFHEPVIYHFFSGKIQDKLISSVTAVSARSRKHPVRMSPIQVAVLVDHLRFKPKSEFQTFLFNFFRNALDSFRKFVKVRVPVSQRTCIVISSAEPAVIQDK